MIEVIADARLRMRVRDLPDVVIERVCQAFTHANPMRAKLERMHVKAARFREPKTIQTYRLDREWLTVPRGGLRRLREILSEAEIERRVIDGRTEGTGPRGIPAHRMTLRDFQEAIVQAAVANENCLVRAPTGSGKTTAALAFAAEVDLPTLVIVWTGNLFDQWVRRAVAELGIDEGDVGLVRGSTCRVRPLTIGMQQTLRQRWPELEGTFGVVICDEVQRFAAGTFFDVVDNFPARYRLGISADERRRDRKEFLIYDVFGEIAVDVKQADLVRQGFVHDVEVRVVPTGFDAPWYVALPIAERAIRFDDLLSEMMTNAERNAVALGLARGEIKHGEQVVLLSHRRDHCRRFDADLAAVGITSGLLLGGAESESEFRRTLDGILRGGVRAAAGTYQAIGQGLDLPSVAVGIATTPIANDAGGRSFFGQVRGRLCRTAEGKDDARIYYLWDRALYGSRPIRNLTRWNRRVVVLDGERWIDGREFVRAMEADNAAEK